MHHKTLFPAILVACVATLLQAPPAAAMDDLYTVTVPVVLDAEDPRAQAYDDALRRVLVRVTGVSAPVELDSLVEMLGDPDRYVLRFRSAEDDRLSVSFDGEGIEEVLRQARQTIWSDDRPVTLVWLAVDWGNGRREIVAADPADQQDNASRSMDPNRRLRERTEEVADYRGIPVVFPLLDAEDLQNVSFTDVWGGFDERLLEASRRYGASSVLVGRVRPDSMQRNRWTYFFGDEQFSWNGEPEVVVNRIADLLSSRFGVAGDAVLQPYLVRVSGVDTIIAYGNLEKALGELSVAEDFQLLRADGGVVEYRVSVYGGIQRLNKALELTGLLQPSTVIDASGDSGFPMSNPNALIFEYRP